MTRYEPALTALAGAMVGLAMAVAAVLAERRPSAGAAGVSACVSADLVADVGAGIGANQGASAEAMSWRPPAWRVGILAGSRVLSSPGCADAARRWSQVLPLAYLLSL